MRFDVRYRTLLTYDELAVDSHNEVRARPATTPHQSLIDYELQISPPASIRNFVDGWGTQVDSFGVRLPHIAMEVIAEATVETIRPPELTALVSLSGLETPSFVDAHVEYLLPTPSTRASPAITQVAARLRSEAQHVLGLATSIQTTVREHLDYSPGATSVTTTAAEAFELGAGVCQDYAHLTVAMARSVGLPARYVSGYFFTTSDADGADKPTDVDGADDLVTVQTHAWVEIAVPGHRWLAMDPTNGLIPGERHVKIGHGPDYDAVMPFRGTFIGPETSEVTASVQIRRRMVDLDSGSPTFSTVSEQDIRLLHAEAAAQHQQQQQQQ